MIFCLVVAQYGLLKFVIWNLTNGWLSIAFRIGLPSRSLVDNILNDPTQGSKKYITRSLNHNHTLTNLELGTTLINDKDLGSLKIDDEDEPLDDSDSD